jgi:hypothetical protein
MYASLVAEQCTVRVSAYKLLMLYTGLSRGDDMDSFLYLLIFLLTGELPWANRTTIKKQGNVMSFSQTRDAKMSKSCSRLFAALDYQVSGKEVIDL